MTRINLIDPKILTNKHLMGEYHEITRPFNKMINRIEKGNLKFSPPEQYVLGSGHETFFFNKLLFLYKRHKKIKKELIKRNYNININNYKKIRKEFKKKLSKTPYWNDYKPTPEECYLNMERLIERNN